MPCHAVLKAQLLARLDLLRDMLHLLRDLLHLLLRQPARLLIPLDLLNASGQDGGGSKRREGDARGEELATGVGPRVCTAGKTCFGEMISPDGKMAGLGEEQRYCSLSDAQVRQRACKVDRGAQAYEELLTSKRRNIACHGARAQLHGDASNANG